MTRKPADAARANPARAIAFHPGDTPDGGAVSLALAELRRPVVDLAPADPVIDPAVAAFMGDCPMAFRPPVVAIAGGAPIVGAAAILAALAAAEPSKLLPRRPAERAVAEHWSAWIETDLVPPMMASIALRRLAPRHLPEAIEQARRVLKDRVARVEAALEDGPTLAGRWSVADMRLMAWLHRADWVGLGLGSRPALGAFADRAYAKPRIVLALAATKRPPVIVDHEGREGQGP
ncbi:glutathione S-transferase family protein [Tistrella mobilis]